MEQNIKYFLNVVLSLMLVLSNDVFSQDQSENKKPRLKFLTDEQALEMDLKLIAKAKGWTLKEARADYEAAKAVGAAAERLAKSHPDLFVGSVLSEEPGGIPSLYVKGSAPMEVYAMAAKSNIHINIVDQQPMSFLELEERSHKIHGSLAEQGYKDFSTSFDFRNEGIIDLMVAEQSGKRQFASAVMADLPKSLQSYVNVRMVSGPIGVLRNAFGGMAVGNNSGFTCTSGWSVEDANGTTGVTTAGHCQGVNAISHPGHGAHTLTHTMQQHIGQWGDIEWLTSTENEPPRFIGNPNNLVRNVTAVEAHANISIGESICVYGRASNVRNCSLDVENVSVSCSVLGNPAQRFVSMNGNVTMVGDSGGGWSANTTAYGSVVGACNVGGNIREIFSVADLYDEALGVTVRTR